ncbi:hypothetical protein ACSBR2_012149 [Camellia fascicularis]
MWKTLNKDMFESYPFSEPFLSANPNLGRTAQCFYQYGDGHGIPHNWTKDHLISLLVQPIPLKLSPKDIVGTIKEHINRLRRINSFHNNTNGRKQCKKQQNL